MESYFHELQMLIQKGISLLMDFVTQTGEMTATRKSVTGYVHCLAGGAISWASRRQSIEAQSTAQAEYSAAYEDCMEGRGLSHVLTEILPRVVKTFCR